MSEDDSSNRPRFVILQHDHPFLHWDLLLEQAETAATWRLYQTPIAGNLISAERIPDHRLHYMDYEGPVSGNRGSVVRIVAGTYCGEILTHRAFDIRFCDTPFATAAALEYNNAGQCFWRFTS